MLNKSFTIPLSTILFLILLLTSSQSFARQKINEKSIVVVIPSYNNKTWYKKNLNTLLSQKYKNYRVIYIDDASTDGTGALVENYIEKSIHKNKFTLLQNTKNLGALENLYNAIHSCSDDDIIVTYDGDDWLPHNNVFKILNKHYTNQEIWLTHGSFLGYPSNKKWGSVPIPPKITNANNFRSYQCPSHLRTFYAWLFKKIKKSDLLYCGNFYSMAWDLAFLLPMIEMAGERHAFINKTMYIYNEKNPLSDFKTNPSFQQSLEEHIRKQKPYRRLINKFDTP